MLQLGKCSLVHSAGSQTPRYDALRNKHDRGTQNNLVLSEVVHINKLIVPIVAGRTMMLYLCVNTCSTSRVSGYGRCAGTECDDIKGARRHYSVRWDVIGKWPQLLIGFFFLVEKPQQTNGTLKPDIKVRTKEVMTQYIKTRATIITE